MLGREGDLTIPTTHTLSIPFLYLVNEWWAISLHAVWYCQFKLQSRGSELKTVLFEMPPVHGQVTSKFVRAGKTFWTVGPGANMWLLSCVSAHVCLEVIWTRKFSLANFTLEWANTSMLATVTSELIRARESLAAAFMFTDIWFLSSVLPDVHLKMREFQVTFSTTWVETDKRFPLFIRLISWRWS